MTIVPRVSLARDYDISQIIKGGWQLAGGHGAVNVKSAHADMDAFVRAGVTTFDCADIYTGVEALIGGFIGHQRAGDAVGARGRVGVGSRPRDEERPSSGQPSSVRVQVHTKCVPDLDTLDHLTAADITRTVERSRTRLGVDAIDLVQFHWWDYTRGDYVAAAQTLADLRERGVIRNLGATNFGTEPLRRMLDAGVPIVAHQVQYSLLDRRPAGDMTSLAQQHGVGLLSYGALAGGFFSRRWLGAPEPTEPLDNRSLTKYKLIIDETGGWVHFQRLLRVLNTIAESHGVGIGSVAIRWLLNQPAVSSVIVGARNAEHLGDTLAALSFRLTTSEQAELDGVLAEQPVPPGDVYELERDRNGVHGRIMRYNLNKN